MAELEKIKSNINLRDIKSSYIIKGIFSYLYDKEKLNMVIYNKVLQKMLKVGYEDYKILLLSSYPFPFHFFSYKYSPSYSNYPSI